MTIKAWENNTEVNTPDGHKGFLQVTRRERELIDAGKLKLVDVRGTDGINRIFELSLLTLVEQFEPETCPTCGTRV